MYRSLRRDVIRISWIAGFCSFVMVDQTDCACPIILHCGCWLAELPMPHILRRNLLCPQDMLFPDACFSSVRPLPETILKTRDF
jgi:hypothetical protein